MVYVVSVTASPYELSVGIRDFPAGLPGLSRRLAGAFPSALYFSAVAKRLCGYRQKTLRLQPKDLAAIGKRLFAYSQNKSLRNDVTNYLIMR